MDLESRIEGHVRQLLAAEKGERKEFIALRTTLTADYSAHEWAAFLRSWQLQDARNPLPELITRRSIEGFAGEKAFAASEEKFCSSLLARSFPDYGVMDEEKAALYFREINFKARQKIRQQTALAFFYSERAKENVKVLIHYGQRNVWKVPCPELIGGEIRSLGEGIFTPFPEAHNVVSTLLGIVYPDYGILDDSKCEIYLQTTNLGIRDKLSHAFFEGQPHEIENARKLVQYTYQTRWKKEAAIPEMVSSRTVTDLIGDGVFNSLGVLRGGNILAEVFPGFGILDDDKCRAVVEERRFKQRVVIANNFYEGIHAQENVAVILRYAWKNKWSTQIDFSELITFTMIREQLGDKVKELVRDAYGGLETVLTKEIPGHSILDEVKAAKVVDYYESIDLSVNHQRSSSQRSRLDSVFFRDSLQAERNIELYLEAYQRLHQRRISDFTSDDEQALPPSVQKSFGKMGAKPTKHIRQRSQIAIKWTASMQDTLRHLFHDLGNGLFEEKQLVWETLGVTLFAAKMKAQRLGLIPAAEFGSQPGSRSDSYYSFVHYDGYQRFQTMLEAAGSIDKNNVINVEAFCAPSNAQGFHVQVPMMYRGMNLSSYSEAERNILETIHTYLVNPNAFKRLALGSGAVVFEAPTNLISPGCIVPVSQEENLTALVKLYLPKRNSQDPGGVFSSVLRNDTREIFFFYHSTAGRLE